MKNIFFLLTLAFSCFSNAQKINVTANGLRDLNDNEKTYLIINAEDKTAKQLYDNAIKYVNKNYKNPEYVIKGKFENEYLKFVTHADNFIAINNAGVKIDFSVDYTIELSFKDNKFKAEIIELDMYVRDNRNLKLFFTGGILDWYIFNKKGELKRAGAKTDIENYFNSQLSDISNFLLEKNNQKDNW